MLKTASKSGNKQLLKKDFGKFTSYIGNSPNSGCTEKLIELVVPITEKLLVRTYCCNACSNYAALVRTMLRSRSNQQLTNNKNTTFSPNFAWSRPNYTKPSRHDTTCRQLPRNFPADLSATSLTSPRTCREKVSNLSPTSHRLPPKITKNISKNNQKYTHRLRHNIRHYKLIRRTVKWLTVKMNC